MKDFDEKGTKKWIRGYLTNNEGESMGLILIGDNLHGLDMEGINIGRGPDREEGQMGKKEIMVGGMEFLKLIKEGDQLDDTILVNLQGLDLGVIKNQKSITGKIGKLLMEVSLEHGMMPYLLT